ncbi:hypothetical protein BC833DRAFT_591015 [Globomyces pollinis-pini]|nr:hypothetical protein BC833DRAFT_591015 [Globomyces pollinis-pini]
MFKARESSKETPSMIMYEMGILEGHFSDIVVHAFNSTFHLHRIILIQNPYFRKLLLGPWKESKNNQKLVLSFNVNDSFMNYDAFKLVLGSIYGQQLNIKSDNVLSIFATALYLQEEEIIQECVAFLLSSIHLDNIIRYLDFIECHYSGSYSDDIINACILEICRIGTSIFKSEFWYHLNAKWIIMALKSNCFTCRSELERLKFISKILKTKSNFDSCKPESLFCVEFEAILLEDSGEIHDSYADEHTLVDIECVSDGEIDIKKGNSKRHDIEQIKTELYKELHLINLTVQQLMDLENTFFPQDIILYHNWLKTKQIAYLNSFKADITSFGELLVYDTKKDYEYIPKQNTIEIGNPTKYNILQEKSYDYAPFPPFRFTVEFSISTIQLGQKQTSDPLYYAGSFWQVIIHLKGVGFSQEPKLSLYLQRIQCSSEESICDPRLQVKAWFQMFCYLKDCHLLESTVDSFSDKQSWGWSSYYLYQELEELKDETICKCSVVLGYV